MIFGRRAERDHKFTQANLSAYIDDGLSRRQKGRVEAHLKVCSECARELDELRATVDLLRHAPPLSAPRSFALPLSVQPEQGRFRRLNNIYGLMRGATVAVSLLFVLLVSGDILIASGAIPLSPRMTAGAVAYPAEGEIEITQDQDAAPLMSEAEEPEMRALAVPEAEPEGAEALQMASPRIDSDDEPLPADTPDAMAGIAAIEAESTPAPGETPVAAQLAPPGMGGGPVEFEQPAGAEADAAIPEEAAEEAAEVAVMEAPAPEPAEEAPATRASAPSEQSAQDSDPAAHHDAPEVIMAIDQPLMWRVWQNIRPIWTALLGALCVLLGGTLWLGYKRRV